MIKFSILLIISVASHKDTNGTISWQWPHNSQSHKLTITSLFKLHKNKWCVSQWFPPLIWKLCKLDCSSFFYRELKPHWPAPIVPALRITMYPWIPARPPPLSVPPWLTVLKIIIFPWAQVLTILISQDFQRRCRPGRAVQHHYVSDPADTVTSHRHQLTATLNPTGRVSGTNTSSRVYFLPLLKTWKFNKD